MGRNLSCRLKLVGEVNNWEYFSRSQKNPKYLKIKMMVCERHNHKCKFCGYEGEALDVVALNHNYRDRAISNLVPACEFCSKPQLLDFYSIDYQGGDKMIFLPDLTQSQLSNLYRVLFYSVAKGGDAAYNAQVLYSKLKDQATYLDDQIGSELSNPAQFVYYIKSANAETELINKIRWLPELKIDSEDADQKAKLTNLVEEVDLILQTKKISM